MKKLPYICPEHPKAPVRHWWDEDYFCHGRKVGKPIQRNHRYECAVCGRQLSATKEDSSDAD